MGTVPRPPRHKPYDHHLGFSPLYLKNSSIYLLANEAGLQALQVLGQHNTIVSRAECICLCFDLCADVA